MIALLKKKKKQTKQKQRPFANQVKRKFETHFWEFVESSFLLNISDFSIQYGGINKQTNKQNNNVSSTPMIKTSRMLSVYLSRNHKTVDNFARTSGNE